MLNPREKYLRGMYINISRMKCFEEAGTLNTRTIWQNLELLIKEKGSIKAVLLQSFYSVGGYITKIK